MQYFHDALSDTVTATTVFDAFDLVGFDDAKITADDAAVKGVAKNPATVGQDIAVMLIGTARVKAKGAIAKGDPLISAATGGVKKKVADPASVNVFATALTAAADGEFVTILVR